MDKPPFFSVVIPTYNRAARLKNAIETVLLQTFSSFEILIIDDGSTDDTKSIVTSFKDDRVKYIYQENNERSAARNNGIKNAKACFICFLDSDDGYYQNHLAVLHDTIIKHNGEVALYTTGIICIGEDGIGNGHTMIMQSNIHPVKFIWKHFLLMNSICVHKQVFEKYLFDERFSIWEDTHLWLRVASTFPVIEKSIYSSYTQEHINSSNSNAFKNANPSILVNYIAAVEDLFNNPSSKIATFISKEDKLQYIIQKCSIFLGAALQNRKYKNAFVINNIRNKYSKNILQYLYQIVKISFLSLKHK